MVILKLMRIDHWVKNALVLFPPFFLGVQFDWALLKVAALAFFSFSLVSSAIYVLNDLIDRDCDRAHPTKCRRPIASGAVSANFAKGLVWLLVAMGGALVIGAHSIGSAVLVLVFYIIANVAYCVHFKNSPIVDLFLLASGFVFRIFYGGFYFGVEISSWLFLCVFSAALFFACGKRKNELAHLGENSATRPVLRAYTEKFLSAHYYVFCVLTIVFYCLWTVSRTDLHAIGKLALTIPIVIFILARYNLLIESRECDGDPVPVFLHDRWLLLSAILFMAVNFVVLYLGAYLPRMSY